MPFDKKDLPAPDKEGYEAYEQSKKDYLGDGVYADFDGYHIVLYTMEGNRICLEPQVMEALKRYENRLKK